MQKPRLLVAASLVVLAAAALAGCSAPGEGLSESTEPGDSGDAYTPPPATDAGTELPFVNTTVLSDLDTTPGAPVDGDPP